MTVKKIISGGQTGADQGGLEAGKALGLLTGGTAPHRWLTEKGPQRELLLSYGLTECSFPGYPARTKFNVLNSDGTVIFGNAASSGSRLTAKYCSTFTKPCLLVSDEYLTAALKDKSISEELLEQIQSTMISESRAERWHTANSLPAWLKQHNIVVLNIAGNRESHNPGIQRAVREYLVRALR